MYKKKKLQGFESYNQTILFSNASTLHFITDRFIEVTDFITLVTGQSTGKFEYFNGVEKSTTTLNDAMRVESTA